jgi:hypothetical protein
MGGPEFARLGGGLCRPWNRGLRSVGGPFDRRNGPERGRRRRRGPGAQVIRRPATPAANLGEEEGAYLQYSGEGAAGAEPAPPPLATGSATAIATLLSIPAGGGAVQILQEYLGGLTEDSPVADALASVAGRLGGAATEQPDAERAFNPGPAEQAAASGEISPSDDNGSTGSGGGSSTGNGGGTDDGGDNGGGGDSGGGDGD